MRKPGHVLLFSAFLLVFSCPGFGQVSKGLHEANITGGLNVMSSGGGSYTVFQLAMAQGYFINENFELGANFSILKAENTDAFGELSGFLSIHFPHSYDSRTVPYIGTQIGFGYGRGDDNPIIFGGYAGVKIFVTEGGGAYSLQVYYTRQSFENGGINNFGVLNGVSIFF